MSTLTFASASAVKMRPAMPGLSGTPRSVMRASSVEWVTAVISGRSMVSSSPTTKVPGSSLKLDRQWMRTPCVAGVLDRAQLQHARAGGRHLEHLLERDDRQLAGVGDDPRVGAEHAGDVGVDLAHLGVHGGGERDRGGVRAAAPERGHVLGGGDALEARDQHDLLARRGASRMRSARTSRMRALVCDVSVTMPACEPVSEIARWPRSLIAIAHSAHDMRSPVESSMSISRGSGRRRDLLGHRDELVGHLRRARTARPPRGGPARGRGRSGGRRA